MRITYIHQYFSTLDSADGVRPYIFSKHLVSKGHAVTIITSDSSLSEKYERMKKFEVDGMVLLIQTKKGRNLRCVSLQFLLNNIFVYKTTIKSKVFLAGINIFVRCH